MSETRRNRLERVLKPLVTLAEFSVEHAKAVCDSSPSYVTSTIKELVREGFLEPAIADDENVYRWKESDNFEPDRWIDQQIHGGQITQTPEQDRPRERLLRDGAVGLSNADLLAILIRVGVRKESAVVGGRLLANRFADRLQDLPKCYKDDLRDISPTVTKVSYAQIMAGIELGRRVASAERDRVRAATKITSTQAAIEYCSQEFARLASDAVQEEFHIVSLDTKHKPIRTHRITVGTLDASLVHPREVFRPAIRDSASAILLVHNHPSGDPAPSREDHQVTNQLTEAGKLLGITVLDHIVVAREQCVSIREQA
ncbi:RadC family protein [Planctomycetes bacterium CA13]